MERLTHNMNGEGVPCKFALDFVFNLNDKTWSGLKELFDRLAAYEDLKRTPKQLAADLAELAEYRATGISPDEFMRAFKTFEIAFNYQEELAELADLRAKLAVNPMANELLPCLCGKFPEIAYLYDEIWKLTHKCPDGILFVRNRGHKSALIREWNHMVGGNRRQEGAGK